VGFKLHRGNSRGLSPPLSANIQGLKRSVEEEEVDRVASSPILKRVREEEQRDSPIWVTGKLGSTPGTRSPVGGCREKGAGQNPEVHPGKGMKIPPVARLEEKLSCGVPSSSGVCR
jgi:hypothetical protein